MLGVGIGKPPSEALELVPVIPQEVRRLLRRRAANLHSPPKGRFGIGGPHPVAFFVLRYNDVLAFRNRAFKRIAVELLDNIYRSRSQSSVYEYVLYSPYTLIHLSHPFFWVASSAACIGRSYFCCRQRRIYLDTDLLENGSVLARRGDDLPQVLCALRHIGAQRGERIGQGDGQEGERRESGRIFHVEGRVGGRQDRL